MIFDEFLIKSLIRKHPSTKPNNGAWLDLSGICAHPKAFHMVIDSFVQNYLESNITHITSVEASAFQFAAPIAYALNKPLIFIRKNKKPPGIWDKEFIGESENNFLVLEKDILPKQAQVLLFDDTISSGETLGAASALLQSASVNIEDIASIVVDSENEGVQKLQELSLNLFSLISF